MSDEVNYVLQQVEVTRRNTALDAAIKTHNGAGYDAVLTAAKAYLAFLTTGNKEQN